MVPRFRWSPGTVSVLVFSILAAMTGAYIAHAAWRFVPSSPPTVCSLIRPEFTAILVPDHDAPVVSVDNADDYRGNSCYITSSTVHLGVALLHVGRGRASDPQTQTRVLLAGQFALLFNPDGPPILFDVGDEAAYQVLDETSNTEVICAARVGTYLVSAEYSGSGLTVDSARDALRSVAAEVLSQV